MWKFIRGKGQQPLAERQKLQKELYAYKKTVQHGFPHKPSAMAYDAQRKLFAIGTHSGAIKVFGRPGVEFYGQHLSQTNNAADCAVQLLAWVPDTGRILSLTTSNQLVLWEPAGAILVPIKTLPFDGKSKKVSSLCCSLNKDIVLIGTEGGNVYQLNLKSFSIKEPVIYLDTILDKLPEYKFNVSAVESIKQIPHKHHQILIAYNRGLCVLWDLEANNLVRSYIATGHGQSVGLYVNTDSEHFTWYHADGSYATWSINDSNPPENQHFVPYGPDPCKSINELVKGKRGKHDIFIFSGGMPRSAYGDRQCVSVHSADGGKVCFDFTSKVIDFFVTFDDDEPDQAQALVVLLEEELCAYDLTDAALKPIKLPYLHSVHASAVTCNHLVSQVSAEIYQRILEAGKPSEATYSDMEWPVIGGTLSEKSDEVGVKEYEILLTGHEDGSVKFWDCTGVVLEPLLHFRTAPLFGSIDDLDEMHENQEQYDDSEPPFRKAGLFDPYSDDPRLAVKKIAFCHKTGQLIVAGTAGNIVCASLNTKSPDGPLKVTTMNLVSDRDGFIWKGHDKLNVKPQILNDTTLPVEDGLQVTGVLQVLPPGAITCLALQSNWNLVAAGTGHGLVLFDYQNHYPVMHRCTLNPNDLTGAGEALSRRKSFKKTLRESFRRLRKGRSTRNNPGAQQTPIAETRPVERQIEARPVEDAMNSLVRCVTFAQTFITNIHNTTPTLWSATNASCVSVFVLNIPPKSVNETSGDQQAPRKMVQAQLAKSIQLKHRAPVVGISIFDHAGVPLELSGPGTAPHRVLIASEEQFKVFSLPQLKPVTKYKLTAHEGARVRKLAFATFSCVVPPSLLHANNSPTKTPTSKLDTTHEQIIGDNVQNTSVDGNEARHTEVGLLCLTNLGDCLVLSIPELKRQINAAAVRREDISGITSLCFTNFGEAVYMMSSSELQRISLSATKSVRAQGIIEADPLNESVNVNDDNDDDDDDEDDRKSDSKSISTIGMKDEHTKIVENLTNGVDVSPSKANVTITSSIGDITVDSVRDHLGDHLNSTVTTLHTTTTEEIVGRLSVLSTQTNNTVSSIQMKEAGDINLANLKDLAPIGETTETSSNTVVVKSIITTISNGQENGETEKITTTTTTRKESQL